MTDWDHQIILDLEREIAKIEAAIAGKGNQDYVRLPIGDARPLLVGAHRTAIQAKRRSIAAIRAQVN